MASRRAYAWAFSALGARHAEIENILQVSTEVVRHFRKGLWRREWLLVTEVQQVEVLSVVVARSQGARGEIVAQAAVSEPADVLLSEEASFHFASSDVFLVERAKNTSPLFGLRKSAASSEAAWIRLRAAD